MIVTVTLNPSLDYRAVVSELKLEATNRTESTEVFPGGKGINVSLMLKKLGIDSRATGLAAGFTGDYIVGELKSRGIESDFVRVKEGMSRINVKLCTYDNDGRLQETEINGQGSVTDTVYLESLMDKLKNLTSEDILVLSGSVPRFADMHENVYEQIIRYVMKEQVKVVVDSEKDTLLDVLSYHPFLVKPNHNELGAAFHTTICSRKEAVVYGQQLQKLGACNVLVSMADKGAVLITQDGDIYEAAAPEGVLVNSVGAGDSMVAGFLAGYEESKDYKNAFALAVACGSAAAFTKEFPEYNYVMEIKDKVMIKAIEEQEKEMAAANEELITVKMDRPLGSSHPEYPSLVYPVNYGYVDGITAPDGEYQDAYVIGIDVPLDEFTGKKIAVVHRKDDIEEKWVIAPENMPFTRQQIEEMIYFQEQYFDSYVEMLNEEMWDAYDRQERKLGYTVPRSMAKSLPDGVYHVVVCIYTVSSDGKLLATQRSKNKTNPLKWEVTGGSILSGEQPKDGAVRELLEETGIKQTVEKMQPLYNETDDRRHGIYHAYIHTVEADTKITLQEGETMNYQWLDYSEFVELVQSDRFVSSEQQRFLRHKQQLDEFFKTAERSR